MLKKEYKILIWIFIIILLLGSSYFIIRKKDYKKENSILAKMEKLEGYQKLSEEEISKLIEVFGDWEFVELSLIYREANLEGYDANKDEWIGTVLSINEEGIATLKGEEYKIAKVFSRDYTWLTGSNIPQADVLENVGGWMIQINSLPVEGGVLGGFSIYMGDGEDAFFMGSDSATTQGGLHRLVKIK